MTSNPDANEYYRKIKIIREKIPNIKIFDTNKKGANETWGDNTNIITFFPDIDNMKIKDLQDKFKDLIESKEQNFYKEIVNLQYSIFPKNRNEVRETAVSFNMFGKDNNIHDTQNILYTPPIDEKSNMSVNNNKFKFYMNPTWYAQNSNDSTVFPKKLIELKKLVRSIYDHCFPKNTPRNRISKITRDESIWSFETEEHTKGNTFNYYAKSPTLENILGERSKHIEKIKNVLNNNKETKVYDDVKWLIEHQKVPITCENFLGGEEDNYKTYIDEINDPENPELNFNGCYSCGECINNNGTDNLLLDFILANNPSASEYKNTNKLPIKYRQYLFGYGSDSWKYLSCKHLFRRNSLVWQKYPYPYDYLHYFQKLNNSFTYCSTQTKILFPVRYILPEEFQHNMQSNIKITRTHYKTYKWAFDAFKGRIFTGIIKYVMSGNNTYYFYVFESNKELKFLSFNILLQYIHSHPFYETDITYVELMHFCYYKMDCYRHKTSTKTMFFCRQNTIIPPQYREHLIKYKLYYNTADKSVVFEKTDK
jgi:hypothetical protein